MSLLSNDDGERHIPGAADARLELPAWLGVERGALRERDHRREPQRPADPACRRTWTEPIAAALAAGRNRDRWPGHSYERASASFTFLAPLLASIIPQIQRIGVVTKPTRMNIDTHEHA